LKLFLKKYVLDSYVFLLVIAGIIVALDQWTKDLVRTKLAVGDMWAPWDWMLPYARFVHWYNTGVAFGMFQNKNTLFIILAICVSIAIIYYYPRVSADEWLMRLAMGMQLGGALGNLVDRIAIGHVTDFISVGNFAVFNIADSSISVGVAVLLLALWLQDRRKKDEELAAEAAKASAAESPDTTDTPLKEDSSQ
jgi:signal peptidase II